MERGRILPGKDERGLPRECFFPSPQSCRGAVGHTNGHFLADTTKAENVGGSGRPWLSHAAGEHGGLPHELFSYKIKGGRW